MALEILVAFFSLLAVIDPFASIPVFILFFSKKKKQFQRKAALEATLAACILLFAFIVFGPLILEVLSVSLTAFMVAGGLLLLMLSFEFIKGELPATNHSVQEDAIVPIGTPLLAGPGAISTSIYFSSEFGVATTLLAVAGVMVLCFIFLYKSTAIGRFIGRNGIRLITRIMGLLTAVVAVSLIEKALVIYGLIGS